MMICGCPKCQPTKNRRSQIQKIGSIRLILILFKCKEQRVFKGEQALNHNTDNPALITNYHNSYHRQLKKNSTRFRLVKGEFTQFVNTQRKNQVLGPLEGQQRTLDRARQTRVNIHQQSISSLQKLKSNSSLHSTFRTSNLFRQKKKLRKSRQLLYNSIKIEQQTRRYHKSPQFELPKVLSKGLYKSRKNNTERQSFYFNTIEAGSSTVNLDNFQKVRYKYKQ